jgi:hypothetical protein
MSRKKDLEKLRVLSKGSPIFMLLYYCYLQGEKARVSEGMQVVERKA